MLYVKLPFLKGPHSATAKVYNVFGKTKIRR